MSNYRVGYFVGTLSGPPINRLLAKALVRPAPAELDMTDIPLGHPSSRNTSRRRR